MKKFFQMCLMAFMLAVCMVAPSVSDAAASATPKTAVLVIGDADIKAPEFMEYIDKNFNADKPKVVHGDKIQSAYQDYWFQKGFLEEQQLTPNDLMAFAQTSGYEKVLYLVIKYPVLESTPFSRGTFITGYVSGVQSRVSMEMKAYLVSSEKPLKMVSVTKNGDSETSLKRAKKDAFKKCVVDVAKEINPLL